MHWKKVDQKWQDRLALTREGDVSWTTEQWPVPGEEPLEVRVCKREGFPVSKFSYAHEAPRTSIVLHQTAGYGQFQGLMGGSDHSASAHFLLGRCGTPYQLVPTEFTAWHATWWNNNSIGIEIDCIANLFKKGNDLVSEYGNPRKDVYCSLDDKDVYLEKSYSGGKYWATMTEKQYVGTGRLIKALCFKHKIPRIVLPDPQRFKAFANSEAMRHAYRGVCTHLQIDPANRVDIGPYIDWGKLIQYGGLTEADCFHPPAAVMETWKDATGGKIAKAGDDAPPDQHADAKPAESKPAAAKPADGKPAAAKPADSKPAAAKPAASGGAATPKSPAGAETLPAPVLIDNHTLRIHVGHKGGRICFSVKGPGDPLPTTPDAGEAPAAKAPGKRDEFIQACMNFLGAPYRAGGKKPGEGIDGASLIAIALRRIELFKSDEEMPSDAEHLSALWHITSGSADKAPDGILPGDLAWFGKGDHDHDPQQHPMVWLGGGRVLGPVPDGGADSAVQIIRVEKVPEKFAGWMHLDDLGTETKHTEHPGEPPAPGAKLTGALLPATPAARYDALKKLVERTKGKWDEGKEKINLVGVKNLHDRCLVSPRPDDWNDTLFAAFLDKEGHKCCLELRASLNPGTDTNRAETWQLWEGSWKFKLGEGDGAQGKALQPDGKVKGWLDKTGMGAPRPNDHDEPAKGSDLQPGTAKKTDEKPPASKAQPERKKPDDKPANTSGKFVFDGVGKKLSVKFGMRMMRALIDWELHDAGGGQRGGCLYSTNDSVKPYQRRVAGAPGSEWPELDGLEIPPVRTHSSGGKEYKVWHAFGMDWTGTGSTNCCYSQLAAVFKALGDGKLRVKKDDGPLEVDLVANTPYATDLYGHPPDDPKKRVGLGHLFSNIWCQGGFGPYHFKKPDGRQGGSLFQGFSKTAPAWTLKYFGIGDSVSSVGCSDEELKKVRLGDSGQWHSHNWLVGDIRYEVTVKGRRTPVYVDQSDFARGENPQPQLKDDRGQGYKLTGDDCLWVEANEAEFESRLTHFLTSKTLAVEGDEKEIVKIKPVYARVFSANAASKPGVRGTNCGEIYDFADGEWVKNDAATKESWLGLGIARGWVPFAWNIDEKGGRNWGFARFYDNAGQG